MLTPSPRRIAWGAIVAASCLALLAVLPAAVRRYRAQHRFEQLLAAAPALDTTTVRHACFDDDARWQAYCMTLGTGPLMDAYEVAQWAMARRPYTRFLEVRDLLEGLQIQIGDELARDFSLSVTGQYARANARRDPLSDFGVRRTSIAIFDLMSDPKITPAARLRGVRGILERYRSLRDSIGMENAHFVAAQLEMEIGHRAEFRQNLEAARALARLANDDYMSCQILGQLAEHHRQWNHEDSAQVVFAEAMTLARAHPFVDQIVRLTSFQAQHEVNEGRPAAAADRLMDAVELVETRGVGKSRARLVVREAKLFAQMDCWNLVDRSLQRLPVLMRDAPNHFVDIERDKTLFDAAVLRARAAFGRGQADQARAEVQPYLAGAPNSSRRIGVAVMAEAESRCAMRAGDWVTTERTCASGLAHCDTAHVDEAVLPLELRYARAAEALGHFDAARRAEADVARRLERDGAEQAGDARLALRVLRARLRLRAGDLAGGRALLREVLGVLGREGPDREGIRGLGMCEATGLSPRDAVHELARLAPAAGYGFEMEWRSLARRGAFTRSDPFAPIRHPGPGTHFVYRFTSGHLLRWTATARGVVLDTLALGADSCLAEVRRTVAALRTEAPAAGRVLGPRAEALLTRLARELLPTEIVRDARTPARIEISPDGPLLMLPFGALVAPAREGGSPLAEITDIVYEAGWSVRATHDAREAVIVANPTVPAGLVRRYAWSGSLRGSDAESQAALQRWPEATLLRGAGATRTAFLEAVPRAEYVYIAAHHVHDPAAPFLGFIPLAAGARTDFAPPMVEARDVRALDLSACRLAVLASCASGAPYRTDEQPGPGLGDAFLDAGARAVVRSFWDVGDEETREFMSRFVASAAIEADPAAALANARREAMRAKVPVPPRVWAAWSIAETRERPR